MNSRWDGKTYTADVRRFWRLSYQDLQAIHDARTK